MRCGKRSATPSPDRRAGRILREKQHCRHLRRVQANPTIMMRWFPRSLRPGPPAVWLLGLVWLALVLPGTARQTPSPADGTNSCAAPSHDEASLRALLQQAANVLRAQDAKKKDFTWQEHESRQQVSGGATIHSKDETWDISTIAGQQYKRLIARDGHPLTPDQQQEQQKKLQAFIADHEPQSAADRAGQAQQRQKRLEREQRQQAALLHNFHFTLTGSRSTPWGKAWIIHATPIAGLSPSGKDARLMSHFAGDLWIEASGCHLMRLDLTILDPVTFGWILGKVDQGGHLLITFAPVDAENWFPQQFSLQAQGRILFKHLDLRLRNDYFDYRHFQVESRILPATPINDP